MTDRRLSNTEVTTLASVALRYFHGAAYANDTTNSFSQTDGIDQSVRNADKLFRFVSATDKKKFGEKSSVN